MCNANIRCNPCCNGINHKPMRYNLKTVAKLL